NGSAHTRFPRLRNARKQLRAERRFIAPSVQRSLTPSQIEVTLIASPQRCCNLYRSFAAFADALVAGRLQRCLYDCVHSDTAVVQNSEHFEFVVNRDLLCSMLCSMLKCSSSLPRYQSKQYVHATNSTWSITGVEHDC
uniref:Uncharacterized protein n=1 Tax=Parascaris univalens TaxID=6257 RepID=A0A915B1P4_PARUN